MTTATTVIDFTDLQRYRFIIKAATEANVTVTVRRGGVVQDLTGAVIKYYANLPTPISKTVGSGITLTDPVNGVFTLTFSVTDTSSQNVDKRADHECKITLAGGGGPELLFEGELVVDKSLFTTMT